MKKELESLKNEIKETKKEMNFFTNTLLIILILSTIFEVGLLGVGFIFADEVSCNLLWCTFSTGTITIESVNDFHSNQSINVWQECYKNGEEVNCSSMEMMNISQLFRE